MDNVNTIDAKFKRFHIDSGDSDDEEESEKNCDYFLRHFAIDGYEDGYTEDEDDDDDDEDFKNGCFKYSKNNKDKNDDDDDDDDDIDELGNEYTQHFQDEIKTQFTEDEKLYYKQVNAYFKKTHHVSDIEESENEEIFGYVSEEEQ